MKAQNYQNHSTLKSLSRTLIAFSVSVISINILSMVNLIRSLQASSGRLSALVIVLIGIALFAGYFLFRSFSLKAQDRAIRAEENLRHFVLTGKLLDSRLTIYQIVALRFAPDEEFIALAERAVKEKMSNRAIKKSVKNWRADYHRA